MAEKIDSQPSLCTSATPEGSNSGNLTMNAEVAFDNNRPNNELSGTYNLINKVRLFFIIQTFFIQF